MDTYFRLFENWKFQSFAPGTIRRTRYNAFVSLHKGAHECLRLLANVEDIANGQTVADWSRVTWLCAELEKRIADLIGQLQLMNPVQFMDLHDWHAKVSFYARMAISVPEPDIHPPFFFHSGRHPQALPLLLAAELAASGRSPWSRCVAPALHHYFVEMNELQPRIDALLRTSDFMNDQVLEELCTEIRLLILEGELPDRLVRELEVLAVDAAPGGLGLQLKADLVSDSSALMLELGDGEGPAGAAFQLWKQALACKYTPQILRWRHAHGLADEEAGVAVWLGPRQHVEISGRMHTLHVADPAWSSEETGIRIEETQDSGTGSVVMLSRRDGHAELLRAGSAILSPAQLQDLAAVGLQMEKRFGAPLQVRWQVFADRIRVVGFEPLPGQLPKTSLHARLSQVLDHITELHVFGAPEEPLRPERCRSLHDLVCLCLDRGLSQIYAFAGKPALGLGSVKQLRLDVPVIITMFNLEGALFPSAAEKIAVTVEDVRSVPLWSLLMGLGTSLVQWHTVAADTDTAPEAVQQYSSHVVLSQFYMYCTLRLDRNLYIIECSCDQDSSANYIHLLFMGGRGSGSGRLNRLRIMSRILAAEGIECETVGDMLDARRDSGSDVAIQRNLVSLGLLIALMQTESASLGTMTPEEGERRFKELLAMYTRSI